LATAIDRLKVSTAKSKIVILLTDGVNNAGIIDPGTALEIAKAFKIKVYTIGVGTQGTAKMPIGKDAFDEWVFADAPVEIDEVLLQKIALETGGQYYRCIDNKALEKVYQQIDQLEKSKIEIKSHLRFKEKYYGFVLSALIILLLVFVLQHTLFKSIAD
jgi:Ca-activated chloride channel family protein